MTTQSNQRSGDELTAAGQQARGARTIPDRAQVIVVGGGIIGTSVAYHLAHMGMKDVLLLERDRLTSGTTWHAAGLMATFGSTSQTSTELRQYTRDLYARLEDETGLATGLKLCGLIELAIEPGRLEEYRRVAQFNRLLGVEVHEISPREVADLWPLARTDDVLAGFYIPDDGRVNPVDVTMSLAKGARLQGVTIIEGVPVTGFLRRPGRRDGSHDRPRRHRGRVRGQLRRDVGTPAWRASRRLHPAAGRRALLPADRADRGRRRLVASA